MVDSCVLRITLLVSCSVVSAIASEVTICSYQDGAIDSSAPRRRRSGKSTEAPPPRVSKGRRCGGCGKSAIQGVGRHARPWRALIVVKSGCEMITQVGKKRSCEAGRVWI